MVSGQVTSHGSTVSFSFSSFCAPRCLSVFLHLLQVPRALPTKHIQTAIGFYVSIQLCSLTITFAFLAVSSSNCMTAASGLFCCCASFSALSLQLKSALSAALPDLGGKTTGCRKSPSDSESWGLEWDPSNPSDLMAFQNWPLQKGTKEASEHYSLGTYLFLQCCMVVLPSEGVATR